GDASAMGLVHEFADEGNDITIVPITISLVPAPDLDVTEIVVPQQVTLGETIPITYTVFNIGQGAVPDRQVPWIDYIYLSRDEELDTRGDIFVGQVPRNAVINPNGSYTVMTSISVPRGLTGAFYV